MQIELKCRKTCPVLTSFIRTCASCGGLPSQGRARQLVIEMCREAHHILLRFFMSQHSFLSPTQRKALNSTAAQLPGSAQCLHLSRLPSSLMGKERTLLRRDSSHVKLRWIWSELLPSVPEPQFSFSLCSQQLGEDGEQGPQATE